MIRNLRSLVFIVGAALALGACETPVQKSGFAELSYSHLPPIRLDVARVDVIREYAAPAQKPNVEHLFPVVPALAAERWANDRLKAGGPTGIARAVVKRASVVEVPLQRTSGLRGALTTDQSERYDGMIEMIIEILDDRGQSQGSVSARSERSRTVPEDITLVEREKVWFSMTEAMMNDLNVALERQIRDHFRRFVRG